MISVNQLIQQATEAVSLVGDGESVDGDLAASSVKLLNQLISDLNSQEYIAARCGTRDIDVRGDLPIYRLAEGETDDTVLDMNPPEKIQGVSVKDGADQWEPLPPCDRQILDAVGKYSRPTAWTYDRYIEGEQWKGLLTTNGTSAHTLRIYYTVPMPVYTLADTIYLSDLYNNLLLQGLCLKLCVKYKLKEYKADFQEEFDKAKNMIKRNMASQRQLHNAVRSYDSYYQDGLHGRGLHL